MFVQLDHSAYDNDVTPSYYSMFQNVHCPESELFKATVEAWLEGLM